MGYPVEDLQLSGFTNKELWLNNFLNDLPHDHHIKNVWSLSCTKELHRLAGNGMAMRAVTMGICILLRSMDPLKVWEHFNSKGMK